MAVSDPKETLHRYLRRERSSLLGKLDGLGERELRWPMTSTGTNLLGLVKHVASTEIEYFGEVFDRPSGIPLPWMSDESEVNSDMWATEQESLADIVALQQASATHADATIEELDLDAVGHVPWWPPERNEVTLHQILVHMISETSRHAGHADIVRELLDGRAGNDDGNLPSQSDEDWAAYRARLERSAEAAGGTAGSTP